MEETIYGAGIDLAQRFASLDFTQGALYYLLMTVAAIYLCFEGFRIYKMALGFIGFLAGFLTSARYIPLFWSKFLPNTPIDNEKLLMVETGIGLACALAAYFVSQVGVFLTAYQFSMSNLVPILSGRTVATIEDMGRDAKFWQPLVGIALGLLLAYLTTKATRPIIVIITAVVGGFAIVNGVYGILVYFPEQFRVTPPNIPLFWMGAKVFLSAAGVGIQGTKSPKEP